VVEAHIINRPCEESPGGKQQGLRGKKRGQSVQEGATDLFLTIGRQMGSVFHSLSEICGDLGLAGITNSLKNQILPPLTWANAPILLPFQIISPPSINHIGANENNV
jgi:hypothetical protein